jgi:hypothetical protein
MRYFLYVFLLSVGIIVGIAIRHYTNVPLEETINLVDVATLVVTVFLAVYIPEVLDRKLQVQRDKKVLIENRIGEFQTLQRKINSAVQDDDRMNEKSYLTIKNELDVSLHKLDTISTLIRFANPQASFEKEIAEIENQCKAHRDLLLIETKDKAGFVYPDEVQQKEEELFNEIDKTTSLLLFKVSDAE